MRKKILLGIMLISVAWIPHSSRANVVFDPTHMLSNLLQFTQEIAQSAEQLNNQMRQIEMEMQNLRPLNDSTWSNLQNDLNRIQNVLNRAEGISYQAGNIDSKFRNLYPDYGQEYAGSDSYRQQYQDWNLETRNQIRTAYQAHGITDAFQNDTLQLDHMINSSNSAQGNLQAVQATNEMLGILGKQLTQLQSIEVANGRAVTAHLSQVSSKEEAERVQGEHAISNFEKYSGSGGLNDLPKLH